MQQSQWEQMQDPNTGQAYFVDHTTKKSTFVNPFGLPAGFEMKLDDENPPKAYFVNHNNQTSSYVDPRGGTGAPQVQRDLYAKQADGLPWGLHSTLGQRNHFYLKQKFGDAEILEALTGCQMANKYELYDPQNRELLLVAEEESDCCIRQCCGNMAPFEMGFKANHGEQRDLFRLKREFACTDKDNCFPCCSLCNLIGCAQTMQVYDGDGNMMGEVKEQYGSWCCNGIFNVENKNKEEILQIQAGCARLCSQCCCQDVILDVDRLNPEAKPYGTINRKFICKCGHLLADLDNFELRVDDEKASVEDKVLTIALAVLMKYLYFEENGDQ